MFIHLCVFTDEDSTPVVANNGVAQEGENQDQVKCADVVCKCYCALFRMLSPVVAPVPFI